MSDTAGDGLDEQVEEEEFRRDFEDVVIGINEFGQSDWTVLKEVLRRHCRTPVSARDLDAAVSDLGDGFPELLADRSQAFLMLMLVGDVFTDEGLADLTGVLPREFTPLGEVAKEELQVLRRMFGKRLRHLLDLPLRGERDWVRVHFDDYEVVGGNSRPDGTLITRIRIELRNGEMLDFEGPPRSVVNLISTLVSHVNAWDVNFVGEDVFADESGRLSERFKELLERLEDLR